MEQEELRLQKAKQRDNQQTQVFIDRGSKVVFTPQKKNNFDVFIQECQDNYSISFNGETYLVKEIITKNPVTFSRKNGSMPKINCLSSSIIIEKGVATIM